MNLDECDRLTEGQSEILQRQLEAAGLPIAVQRSAQEDLAMALAGVRRALAGWRPVPSVTDPAERDALLEKIGEITADALETVVEQRIGQLHRTEGRARRQLQEWNTTRGALRARLTREQRAALTDPEPVDYDTAEWETLPDGSTRPHYYIKPERVRGR
jgi:hypothetical protein